MVDTLVQRESTSTRRTGPIMGASDNATFEVLRRQCHYQMRVERERTIWWIPLIFVAGFLVSVLGLIGSYAELRGRGSVGAAFWVFGVSTVIFGCITALWLTSPLRVKPRVVPCFARTVGEYGGRAMSAFRSGSRLYELLPDLDALALQAGARPLSAFGFGDDFHGQRVAWHTAAEGLRSVHALRDAIRDATPELAAATDDLDVLSVALTAAAEQNIDFSLMIRLHPRESMQVVRTTEQREGSLW